MPQRIQQRRTLGWRKPEGAVAVGRGTKWGNPFPIGKRGEVEAITDRGNVFTASFVAPTAEVAVRLYREFVTDGIETWLGARIYAEFRDDIRAELAGKDLMCWCPLPEPGQPDHCHAAVLLELANPPSEEA